ncbi:MAG: JAB domain-containing protein [Candidatus Eisenbacteria bacterium]
MPLPSPFTSPRILLVETQLVPHVACGERVASAREAATVLSALVGRADREHFVALYLDSRHRVTHAHVVSRGTAQTAPVHPREVFKGAFLANAAALIIGHNHPSGDVEPSVDDRALTARLRDAGELLGITVLDSVIVGPSRKYFSEVEGSVFALPRRDAVQVAEGESYSCPDCGSHDVELCFPVWVPANAIDDRERWELDIEAQPEKDGDKGWCSRCETHVLVTRGA